MCLKAPLGLPGSPRTEWEVSRRPPAKMSQSGPPDLRMTQRPDLPPGAGGGRAGRGAPRGGVSYSFGRYGCKKRVRADACGRAGSSDQFASGQ